MYCHGLAAITLCEAYALTQDKALAGPAQQSINWIVYAQDKTGGGWRYSPGQPGDTSAVGWQIMALKSGHLAYLDVPAKTIAGAINFLNLVQSNSGANYGYTGPGAGPGKPTHRDRPGLVYVRDDRPFRGTAPPADAFFYSPDRKAERPRE